MPRIDKADRRERARHKSRYGFRHKGRSIFTIEAAERKREAAIAKRAEARAQREAARRAALV